MAKKVRPDARLREFLRRARQARSVKAVEVGFYSESRYADGTPVPNVALWNEFGTVSKTVPVLPRGARSREDVIFVRRRVPKQIPERPFFRLALKGAGDELMGVLRGRVDPQVMAVDPRLAGELGAVMQARVQRSITSLRQPKNAPITVLLKGSSNPLIDEGHMRRHVTFKVVP